MKWLGQYRKSLTRVNREAGQTAIITVTMFMLLFSVVVISFTRIMVNASHDTVNDELHASARAAAESGIEDAKRILSYCGNLLYSGDTTTPKGKACATIRDKRLSINGDIVNADGSTLDCKTVIDQFVNQVSGDLDLNSDGSHRIKIAGTTDSPSAQYYQCLRIATQTSTYEGVLSLDGKSQIVPLKFVNDAGEDAVAAKIIVSWHKNSETADQEATDVPVGNSFPSMSQWNQASTNRPAVIRAEFVKVPASFTIQSLADNARAVTVRPARGSTSGAVNIGNNINIDLYRPSTEPNPTGGDQNPPLVPQVCSIGGGSAYACSAAFTRNGTFDEIDGATHAPKGEYYLRLQAIYKDTHFQITALDEHGNKLYFKGVQPIVDVTGKSGEAYERVQARLEPINDDANLVDTWWPEYAIDTNGQVCKDITVTYEDGTFNCP